MVFSLSALLFTLGCCLVSMIIAGKSGSNEDKEWFANLKHPDNSFLPKIIYTVGVLFYLLLGFVLYHLFVIKDVASIALTIAIIQLMGLSPFFKYKTKNLKLFFFVTLIIPVITLVLIVFLLQSNPILAIPIAAFLMWLVYDFSYYYRLMKLNT